jgi:hypothetical protein
MRQYFLTLGFFAFVVGSARPAVPAPISALPADFSTTINSDTSTWSYRYRPDTNRNGNYLLLPTYGPSAGTWTPSNPNSWNNGSGSSPEFGVNLAGGSISNTTATPADSFTLASGDFWVRPGAGQLAILSWLFPFSTPQSISLSYNYTFNDIDPPGGDGKTVYTESRHSDGTAFNGFSSDDENGTSTGGGNHQGFIGPFMYQPGDRVDFIVDPKTNANFDAISLSVTVVPEPSSLLLAITGIGIGIALRLGLHGRCRVTELLNHAAAVG